MTSVEAAKQFAESGSLDSLILSCRRLEGLDISSVNSELVAVLEIVAKSIPNVAGCPTTDETEELAGILMSFVEIFDKIGKNEECSLSGEGFTQLVAFTNAIRSSPRWKGVNAPLIIWPKFPWNISLYPKTFEFCEHINRCSSVMVKLSEIKTLVHSTSATALLSILDLTKANGQFRLKVNRNLEESKIVADVTTGGILYCGFELPESKKEAMRNSYATENRYGSCVLKFPAKELLKTDGRLKFVPLGTKFYTKEWCQMILVDSRDRQKDDNWRIASCNTSLLNGGAGSDYFSINKADYVDIESFEWNLRYCKRICKSWTHPVLLLCEDQLLEEEWLKVGFEHHVSCPDRWNCIECHISKGGKVKARRVINKDNNVTEEEVVEVPFGYPLKDGDYGTNKAIAIRMFAQSVPIEVRIRLETMQGNLRIFREGDFKEIADWWEKEQDYYYKDWTPVQFEWY
jgi:hypothetical protein